MPKMMTYADLGDFDVITNRLPNIVANPTPQPSPPSKHEAAYRTLKDLIAEGELRSERDFLLQPLAIRLDISRNTLTRALNRLVIEELVRHTPQKGYALLLPTTQQIERWYKDVYERVRNALVQDQGEKRQRQYGISREGKLALAESLPDLAPPLTVAAEFEELLRTAVARTADITQRDAFEIALSKLTAVRRIEHLTVPDHRDDVAQLMRSFYRGQYDRFLRMLSVYTEKRVRVAGVLAVSVQIWSSRADAV